MQIVYLNKSKPKERKKSESEKAVEWMVMRERRAAYKELKPRLDALGITEQQFFDARAGKNITP